MLVPHYGYYKQTFRHRKAKLMCTVLLNGLKACLNKCKFMHV